MNMQPADTHAADLLEHVMAVPGVRGVEPGIGGALKVLDARLRGVAARQARFGLILDPAGGSATVEIAVEQVRPVQDIVRDVQLALRPHLPEHTVIRVRVQSLPR